MTLFVRIGVLIIALKETIEDPYDNYEVTEVEFFFYFEIPFNFIITGLIVQFYQWYQFGVFIKHELDANMIMEYRVRYKLCLLISIIVCFSGLITQFTAVVMDSQQQNSSATNSKLLPNQIITDFKIDMDWVMISIYTVVSISFLPLFISIMLKMKKHYANLYTRVRVKFSLLFTVFMIFILSRLFLYFDVKSLKLLYTSVTMYTVLPFYITEIVMAVFLSYILYTVNKMDRASQSNILTTSSDSFIVGGTLTPTTQQMLTHNRDRTHQNLSQIMLNNNQDSDNINERQNHYLSQVNTNNYSNSINQQLNPEQQNSSGCGNLDFQNIQRQYKKSELLVGNNKDNNYINTVDQTNNKRFKTIHLKKQQQHQQNQQQYQNQSYQNQPQHQKHQQKFHSQINMDSSISEEGTYSNRQSRDNINNNDYYDKNLNDMVVFQPKTIEEDDDDNILLFKQDSTIDIYNDDITQSVSLSPLKNRDTRKFPNYYEMDNNSQQDNNHSSDSDYINFNTMDIMPLSSPKSSIHSEESIKM